MVVENEDLCVTEQDLARVLAAVIEIVLDVRTASPELVARTLNTLGTRLLRAAGTDMDDPGARVVRDMGTLLLDRSTVSRQTSGRRTAPR
jgi:hypothetical protein